MDSHTLLLYGDALTEKKKYTPIWKQEAKGIDGRKRFHGAFTGGFSAGYYNTVGSKEGWEPASFISSRNARSTTKIPREEFMDEEDMGDYLSSELVFCKSSASSQDKLSTVLDAICRVDNPVLNSMGFSPLDSKKTQMDVLILSALDLPRQESKQSTTSQAYKFTHEGEIITLEKSYPAVGTPITFNPDQIIESKTSTSGHSNDTVRQEALSPEAAARALRGFMPFERFDPNKNERYREFLRLVSSHMDVSRFEKEQQEFVRTAQIFQPLHGSMAEKFVNPKNQAGGIEFDKPGASAFVLPELEHRKSVEWTASPLLKKRFGVEHEETPKITPQSLKSSHAVEEMHDPLPTCPEMATLREIYSPDYKRKTDKVVFRKPQPKNATITKPGGQNYERP